MEFSDFESKITIQDGKILLRDISNVDNESKSW